MDTANIRQILADQQEEIQWLLSKHFVRRAEESLVNLDSSLAQVVMGVRRAGKSTLCINALKKSKKKFAYANFDDEQLANSKPEDLNIILESLYRLYGDFEVLFIDEIQNLDEWHLFVNRLLRQGLRLLITGSNSKLLSGELATHLTGRSHPIELHPFSFSEYCSMKNVDTASFTTKATAFQKNAFDAYLSNGGFPELAAGKEDPFSYVNNLVSGILKQDIEKRFHIRYKTAFENFANHLLNQVPMEINTTALSKTFGFKSFHTTENYIGYLKQACLILELHKYSNKSRIRLTQMKAYPVDCSIMNNRKDAYSKENLGWRLECIVFLELLKRCRHKGYDIYYFKEEKAECDFLVAKGAQIISCIQVSYDPSDRKTLARELRGLEKAAKAAGCSNLLLLTYEMNGSLTCGDGKDVTVLPVYEWTCQQSPLGVSFDTRS